MGFRILSFFIFPTVVYAFSWFMDLLFDIYHVYLWVDIPMHFLGGLAISYTIICFIGLFREKNILLLKNKWIFSLVVVGLVALIAILWEFYEFFMKVTFGLDMQPSLNDTLLDLFMGLLGGLAGSLLFRKV